MPDYSAAALDKFLNFIADKGLVSWQQAQNWRVATAKITDDLSSEETADIRHVDLDAAFQRFANKNGARYTPQTLTEYKRRTTSAIENFIRWTDAPMSYKPQGRIRSQRAKSPTRSADAGDFVEASVKPSTPPAANQDALTLPYPLRDNFLVQIRVPRDLSLDEAKRIGAFVLTLSREFRPPEDIASSRA